MRVILVANTESHLFPENQLQVRLVIPQQLKTEGRPVYLVAQEFFAAKGSPVFLQEKLLKLSKSLPAILEGLVEPAALESFLLTTPHVDSIIVLTQAVARQSARSAA